MYVKRAIAFVRERLALGIGLSIPVSLFFSVITLELLGRWLNVISLAGLAFSTGIVIDAALIVQGNIIRYFQQGEDGAKATIGGIFVYRVNGDQRAERVDVKLGIADGDWIAVDEGLSPGDAVVVRGGESLRPDQDVKVVGVFEHETTRISVTVVADDGRS